MADEILRQGITGISDIVVKPGLINVDFADVRAVMTDAGPALMGMALSFLQQNTAGPAAMGEMALSLFKKPVKTIARAVDLKTGFKDQHLTQNFLKAACAMGNYHCDVMYCKETYCKKEYYVERYKHLLPARPGHLLTQIGPSADLK